ncbi:hypothetical protein LTR15_007157 [Elasticomyces elasticus]|nr:hypothetical protein LTR15_007157 [Elasticomyces elasticus]
MPGGITKSVKKTPYSAVMSSDKVQSLLDAIADMDRHNAPNVHEHATASVENTNGTMPAEPSIVENTTDDQSDDDVIYVRTQVNPFPMVARPASFSDLPATLEATIKHANMNFYRSQFEYLASVEADCDALMSRSYMLNQEDLSQRCAAVREAGRAEWHRKMVVYQERVASMRQVFGVYLDTIAGYMEEKVSSKQLASAQRAYKASAEKMGRCWQGKAATGQASAQPTAVNNSEMDFIDEVRGWEL